SVFPSGNTAVSNSATIQSNETGQTSSNTVTTTVNASPSLSVTKGVDKTTASPGNTLTYTLSYANTGNAAASGVVITDALPARTTFVSASASCVNSSRTFSFSIGTVAPGATLFPYTTLFRSSVFPSGNTAVSNSATIQSNETG